MKQEHDERFEPAAVRWLGKLLSEHAKIGLDLTRQVVAGMRELAGTAPESDDPTSAVEPELPAPKAPDNPSPDSD
jgi:hypothetical protein